MLTVAEASASIMADIKTLDVESVPLRQALGRVLADDVAATVTMASGASSPLEPLP